MLNSLPHPHSTSSSYNRSIRRAGVCPGSGAHGFHRVLFERPIQATLAGLYGPVS